ncbi:MAG: hypothetical protein PHS92_05530 [Candidatus Gracilibacteria bacterium]|nr:hypothetical protein [Candidatus Gracilibacteria bacterium]
MGLEENPKEVSAHGNHSDFNDIGNHLILKKSFEFYESQLSSRSMDRIMSYSLIDGVPAQDHYEKTVLDIFFGEHDLADMISALQDFESLMDPLNISVKQRINSVLSQDIYDSNTMMGLANRIDMQNGIDLFSNILNRVFFIKENLKFFN